MSTAIDGIPELWADLKQFAVPAKNSIYWTSFPARKAARGAMKYILVTPTKHLNDFLWNVGYIYRNLSTFGRVLTWNANRLKYSSRNGATMELGLNISLGTPPKIKSTLIFFWIQSLTNHSRYESPTPTIPWKVLAHPPDVGEMNHHDQQDKRLSQPSAPVQ